MNEIQVCKRTRRRTQIAIEQILGNGHPTRLVFIGFSLS